jgi:hypothetical protein
MPKILKIRSKEEAGAKFKHLPKPLLKPPFVLILCGSVRTGKSTIIMNFLYNEEFYKDMFDKVIFISPTVRNDLTLTHLADDDEVIKIDDDLDNLDDILKTIVETKQEDKEEQEKHYLIILDDMMGLIKRKSYATYLCTRYRHYKLSIIITCQSFRSLNDIIRTNAKGYLIFKTNNDKEYKKMEDEFKALFKNFDDLYEYATDQPYSFLFLNLRDVGAYKDFEKEELQ